MIFILLTRSDEGGSNCNPLLIILIDTIILILVNHVLLKLRINRNKYGLMILYLCVSRSLVDSQNIIPFYSWNNETSLSSKYITFNYKSGSYNIIIHERIDTTPTKTHMDRHTNMIIFIHERIFFFQWLSHCLH